MTDGPLSHINLMLATPSATNQYCGDYVESLIITKENIEHFGGNMAWQKFPGCSDLCHARNKLLGNFVKMEQYTHLLIVDDDMGWVADDVIRMLLLDKDFISGAGPKKQFPKEFCCSNRDDKTDEKIFPNFYHAGETLLCDMNYVGAGFVLISRNCAVKMTESYQDLAYFDSFDKQMEVGLYDPITITKNDGKYRYFDDFAFCYRWRMIGGKVVIVPDIRLKHTGNYTFEGQLTEMFEYGEEKEDGTGRTIGALQASN